jgi:iron complex outermembrane recepter protein
MPDALRIMGRMRLMLACLLVSHCAGVADVQLADLKPSDLTDISIEDLMSIKVTIASKQEEELRRVAAAIHVITQEDIRRSGATSIPEALRLAPGLHVARVDAHNWAISARGFNDVFANKLLVMIDGRTVYTPLFSGVFWEVQDTMLEDIDRIEVIRGPGATLWGANAVNGVINVVTKKAEDTQGWLASGGGGSEERGFGAVRYGGKAGENTFYRLYGRYHLRDDSALATGFSANDAWEIGQGGLRVDWVPTEVSRVTFQADGYAATENQTYTRFSPVAPHAPSTVRDAGSVAGGNVQARWTRTISDESELTLQSYYDATHRDTVIFAEDRHTYDLDLQHRFALGDRHRLIWGAGYRISADSIRNADNFEVSFSPPRRTTQLGSFFLQDEITLVEDRLALVLGSKFEHNDFTGVEVQPSGRLVWTPNERHTLWGSVSRAVRTPSRAEDDVRLNQPSPPLAPVPLTSIFGSRGFGSEELLAYEIGYRVQPHRRLSLDLAAFYNDYDDIRSAETTGFSPGPPAHIVIVVANSIFGETYGGEAAATWQAADWWRWHVGYTYLQMQMHTRAGSTDTTTAAGIEGASPHHQISFRSSMDLPANVEFDIGVRYVDVLPSRGIAGYAVMDARLGWRPRKNLELSLVAQSLLDNQHPEFGPTFIQTQATEIQHGAFARVTWRY